MISWQRRTKPLSTALHAFRDGNERSLCGIVVKARLEVWEPQEASVKCWLCERKAGILAKPNLRPVDRRAERSQREREAKLADGRKFGGQAGMRPVTQARLYVYKMLAQLLHQEIHDGNGGPILGGHDNPEDLRQLRYAMRTIHGEMVRKGDGGK